MKRDDYEVVIRYSGKRVNIDLNSKVDGPYNPVCSASFGSCEAACVAVKYLLRAMSNCSDYSRNGMSAMFNTLFPA